MKVESLKCGHCQRDLSTHVAINLSHVLQSSSKEFCNIIRRIAAEMVKDYNDVEPIELEVQGKVLEVLNKAADDFEQLLIEMAKTFEARTLKKISEE